MDYQDFVLQLDCAPGEQGFVTRVVRSPAGEAEAPFVNPILRSELDNLWLTALSTRDASRGLGQRDVGSKAHPAMSPLAAELSLEKLGDCLFQALFPGPVGNCWMRSLAESERIPEQGLRLKLQLNVSDPRLAPLAELPWECLFSPEQGGFLGLQRKTPILRHVRLPLPTGQAPATQPLRILTVSCQPRSMPALSLGDEGARIAEALGTLPGVETLSLQNPMIEDLRESLLQRKFHVLHFMGHGGFDSESGQGVLYFAGKDGGPLAVSGPLLASHLAGLSSLRLVFVNACETARTNARAPFAGVATSLLRAGLPAVIAMQRPIRDDSALEFSRTVYRRLAAGDPIDAAVTEGRLAIARGRGALLEWGTPVLFLRAEDGRLFASDSPAIGEFPAPTLPEIPSSPQAARSNRLPGSLLLAGALAAGIALGSLRLFQPTAPLETNHGSMTSEPQQTTDSPEFTTDQPPPEPEKKKDPLPDKERQAGHREPPKPEPKKSVPPPRPSSSFVVTEGNPISVPSLNAELGANFYERDGHAFARFWVTPPGEGMLQQPPVVGPGPIEFSAQNGTYQLDVQSLNLAEKRATVHLSFLPKAE